MRILTDYVIFVMVDIQERFRAHLHDVETLIRNVNILNHAAEILDLPILVTEQNPRGLGPTFEDIYIPEKSERMTKTKFSIFDEDIEHFIRSTKRNMIVLYGIESHICILQSMLEALSKDFVPIVVEDAVTSISPHNKQIAMTRIKQEGGIIVSTEMLLFELIKDAIHPDFKQISNLVKRGTK